MTYTPPPHGWVEVHIDPGARAPSKQRFHVDRPCGEAEVASALARKAPESTRQIHLSAQMPYAQTRKLKNLSHCKCAKAHRVSHPVNERRNPRERLQAPPGSGRRR